MPSLAASRPRTKPSCWVRNSSVPEILVIRSLARIPAALRFVCGRGLAMGVGVGVYLRGNALFAGRRSWYIFLHAGLVDALPPVTASLLFSCPLNSSNFCHILTL